MHNHYIPRSYLKGFTESLESDFIYRYEKGTKKYIRSNILKVGKQKGFYSDEVEEFLADSFDGPIKGLIVQLGEHKLPTEPERALLKDFMIIMLQRVPASRERALSWLEKNIELRLSHLEKQINQFKLETPGKTDILDTRLEEIKKIRNEKRIKPVEIWYKLISVEHYSMIGWAIENMTWKFMSSKEGLFLTSDNPVFFFREMGLGRKASELFFPISSKVGLWATWKSEKKAKFLKADNEFVKEMNRRIVSTAHRYVFGPIGSESLANLVSRPNRHLRHLISLGSRGMEHVPNPFQKSNSA